MTSRLVYDDTERLLAWACERIGIGSFRSDAQAIGIEKDDQLAAVVIYDTFSSTDCFMHVASDGSRNWLTRTFLKHAFAYPFITCNLPRVSSPIAESNQAALKFNMGLGFVQEGYHPMAAHDGGAILSMGLLRRSCIYIPKEHRK